MVINIKEVNLFIFLNRLFVFVVYFGGVFVDSSFSFFVFR